MKTLLTKIFTATASAAVAVAGLSGLAQFSQTVRADFYTPRLIVTGSEISKDRVNAGDEFDLTVHFINESEDTHLYNIKIAFTSEDNEMQPVSGTNVYYVDTVEDEEEFDVTVKMATRSDLAPKPYTLTVSYEFEDRDKMYFQDSSEIVIPIYQTPELLSRDYYINCDMSKYIAYIIDTLNHDCSIAQLLDPYDRIENLVRQYKEDQK